MPLGAVFASDNAGWLFGSKTFDPPNIGAGAVSTTTLTVTDAELGDHVDSVAFSLNTQGIVLSGEITAADTMTVTFNNVTGGAVNLASGTLSGKVSKAG